MSRLQRKKKKVTKKTVRKTAKKKTNKVAKANEVELPRYETKEDFERAEKLVSLEPNTSQFLRINDITRGIIGMTHCVQMHCPPSRERSLALTKLEEAKMWANRSMMLNEQ